MVIKCVCGCVGRRSERTRYEEQYPNNNIVLCVVFRCTNLTEHTVMQKEREAQKAPHKHCASKSIITTAPHVLNIRNIIFLYIYNLLYSHFDNVNVH